MGWPGPSSRRRLLAAALGVWLGSAAAGGAEPVLARVLALTPGRVTLRLEGPQRGPDAQLDIPVDPGGVPDGVAPGRLVRVWPGPNGLAAGARLVPLDTDLGGADRTGVRARLMHGAGRGFGGGRGGR